MPDGFGNSVSESNGYLRERNWRILDNVMKQTGDYYFLVKPRSIEDDRDGEDMGNVGSISPPPSLASMALGCPAQRLLKARRD